MNICDIIGCVFNDGECCTIGGLGPMIIWNEEKQTSECEQHTWKKGIIS